MKIVFPILFMLTSLSLFGQKIDNMASFRDIKNDCYLRFNYDNDYFASTDKDYTQGYNFELVSPFLDKNPINILFLKPKRSEYKYGIAIEHIGYSPNNIKSPEIQFGDRPFAAAIMLKSFAIATDTIQNSRFVSSLNLGIIGPGAFGKEMQVAIHEATGNTIPQGWKNQIKNDLVLNYEMTYEKQLLRYRNFISVQTFSTARIGTLFTNASIGGNIVVGVINSPFTSLKDSKNFQLYFYSQPMVAAVGYDATLQGGLFNDESPYTISSNSMKRFTAQHQYGIVMQTKTLYFEYSRAAITREFADGSSAKWGGIRIGFTF